ncbi:folate-binding protein YgfZ [Asticcacaulis sp. AC402]|uniref:CAF17-like 4Fe-4S cluster assembly/insertion protein YgfZ n=1 Tax=Asticcacaulis sp. AC402 TaxID=1282361 RepID=UPI0003C4128E|nr:folate-binding protein YgfZ [Asticcacaulis sp. AC402]ESQ76812.1 hypothetical protein ABAC402_03890 [Asticcacaulis sp. AC402]
MTCIAHLPHRALIRITGPDWAPFLKGLCTARIDDLIRSDGQTSVDKAVYGAFLRPQGKMYADCLLLTRSADEIWLDVPDSAREELLAKLNMYRLRAKVRIEALDQPVFVAFDGPSPDGFVADPRSDIIGTAVAWACGANIADAEASDWAAFRYRHGLAEAGYDFEKDELYAIDANLDLLNGIDFKKGCYVGQELTSRMKRRGQIKNRILPFRFGHHPPDRDAEILNDGKRAGNVLACGLGWGLALMRLDRMEGALLCSQCPIDLVIPAWVAPHLSGEAA